MQNFPTPYEHTTAELTPLMLRWLLAMNQVARARRCCRPKNGRRSQ